MKTLLYSFFMICLCHNINAQNTTSYSDDNDNRNTFKTVMLGVNAGTTSNRESVVIGFDAGAQSTGTFATLIGRNAGRDSDVQHSVFIGTQAGEQTVNSSNNVAIGTTAGSNMDGAVGNLMFGAEAGLYNDGSNNVFIGYRTGKTNRGDDNIYIGQNAGATGSGSSGNVCIGKDTGRTSVGNDNVIIGNKAASLTSGLDNNLFIENSTNSTPLIFGDFSTDKVGINTKNLPNVIGGQNISNYTLYVQGGMLSDEVRVRTSWADYVFKENYELKSITELEHFIDEFGHLPNCPSEKEVNEQGIEIGDISRMQQEKIEELTLYIIQQEKRLNSLHSDMENLKSQVNHLLENKD